MDIPQSPAAPEFSSAEIKRFDTLQAHLALHGVELHHITETDGREAFSVNVGGQLRTLDTLPQVAAYAKCLGVAVCT